MAAWVAAGPGPEDEEGGAGGGVGAGVLARKCVVGVCAMDKKTLSAPMTQILDRLRAYGEFEVVVFGNKLLLDDSIPVEEWPRCDCFISFFSKGFPHEKAVRYVELFRPHCINDVASQAVLRDRQATYRLLVASGIPTTQHLFVDRRGPPETHPRVVCTDDYLEVDGQRMNMPLVEKPFDGDNHNVNIYYGCGAGGRRLFRKVKNRSSEFEPGLNRVRTDASYTYEPFLANCKDLKVYTLGPHYAHAETRKSPAVDGRVERDPDGKELRLLTRLTEEEKSIARRVAIVFKQNICGFDVLRWKGRSYVIDVNGWSFVKGNLRYYDKAARILRRVCLASVTGRAALAVRRPYPPLRANEMLFSPSPRFHMFPPSDAVAMGVLHLPPAQRAIGATGGGAVIECGSCASVDCGGDCNGSGASGGAAAAGTTPPEAAGAAEAAAAEAAPSAAAAPAAASSSSSSSAPAASSSPLAGVPPPEDDPYHAPAPIFGSGVPAGFGIGHECGSPASDAAAAAALPVWTTTAAAAAAEAAREAGEAPPPPEPFVDGESADVLLAIAAVFRHGDRTPKQKVKVPCKWPELLAFFPAVPQGARASEVPDVRIVAKHPQMTALARAVETVLARLEEASDEAAPADERHARARELAKMRQVRTVLYRGSRGTKVQLKAKKAADGAVTKALLVCKWGGEITHAGLAQTKQYAPVFWDEMLRPTPPPVPLPGQEPPDDADNMAEYMLTASRSSAFHDPAYRERRKAFVRGVQLFASDEARVRATAKAFMQSTFDLAQPPPSEAVHTDGTVQAFLDDISPRAKELMNEAKRAVKACVLGTESFGPGDGAAPWPLAGAPGFERCDSSGGGGGYTDGCGAAASDAGSVVAEPDDMTEWGKRCLRWLGVPRATLQKVYELMKALLEQIDSRMGLRPGDVGPAPKFEEYSDDENEDTSGYSSQESDDALAEARRGGGGGAGGGVGSGESSDAGAAPADDSDSDGASALGLSSSSSPPPPPARRRRFHASHMMCMNETLLLMRERWQTLVDTFYDAKRNEFDPTKVPDVYDCIKYDVMHNSEFLEHTRPLYRGIARVADFVIPQEYGVFRQQKFELSRAIVQPLLSRIADNLEHGLRKAPDSRAFLYFSSESHLHALRNTLLLTPGVAVNASVATTLESVEINYLAHGVLRLYEDRSRPPDDPLRLYVSVQFSPGAALDPHIYTEPSHLLPVSRPVPVNGRIPFAKFKALFAGSPVGAAGAAAAAKGAAGDGPE